MPNKRRIPTKPSSLNTAYLSLAQDLLTGYFATVASKQLLLTGYFAPEVAPVVAPVTERM